MMPSLSSRINDRLFYGWVVVIASVIIVTFMLGTRYSFGVFLKSIESDFGLSRGATSGIFSVSTVFGSLFAIWWGWASDRFGPRIVAFIMGLATGSGFLLASWADAYWQLLISYGVLLAMGSGLYSVIMSTVSRWFIKKRGLALGLANVGGGLGVLLISPLAAYLVANLGWRTSYLALGLMVLLVVLSLSVLLRRSPGELGLLPDGVKSGSGETQVPGNADDAQPTSFSLLEAYRNSRFWLIGLTQLSYSLCYHLVLIQIVPHATDLAIPATGAALVLGLIGGISIPGRIIMGGVSDRIGRKAATITCALLQVGAMTWLIWSQDLWMFYLFAVVYGFGYGGLVTMVTVLAGDIFGTRNIGAILGSLTAFFILGAAIGPMVGGFIYDISNGYFAAFVAGAVAMLISTLLLTLLRLEKSRSV